MTAPEPSIDDRLAEIATRHFDATADIPVIIDVTGAGTAAVEAVATLPVITFERTSDELPPRLSPRAHLVVPDTAASALVTAVERNPHASLILTQLIRATADLPVPSALAMESIAYSALQSGSEYRAWLASRDEKAPTVDGSPRVAITAEDDAMVITLTRASHANALDTHARHELVEALIAARLGGERVVLRGDGDHFCTGGDLEEFSLPDDPTRTHHIRLRQGVPGTVASIAADLDVEVHGAVIGAGIELSAFARRVVARPDARFRLPEIRMGLLPGSGGTVSVPRRIGANRALILMLTGRVLKADQALAWGLVDEIVP